MILLLFTQMVSAQVPAVEHLQSMQVSSLAMDAVAFSPDGMRIATGGRDNIIRVWDANSGELLMQTEGHADWVTSLAFTPDGTQIVSGSRDDTIRHFDANSGALLGVIGRHEDEVTAITVSGDGTVIASGGRDGFIKFWNTQSGEMIHEVTQFEQAVWHLAFDPAENFIASASEDGRIWLWGLQGEIAGSLKQLIGHTEPVVTFAFSPDGTQLLSGGLDGTMRLWDMSDLSGETIEAELTLRGHLAPVMGVGFSADGRVAISASLDGTVRLWDIAGTIDTGLELSSIRGSGTPLTNLRLNPAHDRAAVIGTDGVLNLWDMSESAISTIIEANRNVAIPPVVTATEIPRAQSIETVSTTLSPANRRFLSIPSAGISSNITTFPMNSVTWEIDPLEPLVGHFQNTARVTHTGNVVLGGHSEYPDGSPGIFRSLYNVGIGDEIFVQDGDIARRYIVVHIREVDYRDLSVVYPTTFNRLTLITCDIPSYVAEQGLYYERLVIIADEIPS